MLILDTHNTTTPGSLECCVLVELDQECSLEVIEVLQVFLGNISEGNAGCGFQVAESSESGLSFNEAEWNFLLSAKGWKEDHDLWWVNIVGHDDELGFSFFNKGGDVVQTILEVVWLWSNMTLFILVFTFSFSLKSLLLISSLFR